MLYAISDIHGCLDELKEQMEYIDLTKNNKIIFLGDYIDYGPKSFQVLDYIKGLQDKYGKKKVVVLKGNHESMLIDWYDTFNGKKLLKSIDYIPWLSADSDANFRALSTFFSEDVFEKYEKYCKKASFTDINLKAAKLLKKYHSELINWIKKMPLYYETDTQIFVHAGIDEEAENLWKIGTPEEVFLWKYPATTGLFYKNIISGRIGTATFKKDSKFHDIYHDGESHYFIDGSVYGNGKLLVLGYEDGKYYQVCKGKKKEIESKK